MIIQLGLAAVVAASLFTGAAGYISLVEHPARLELDDASLLGQWKPSYARALPIQSALAVAGGVLGLIAWYLSKDWRWAAGGLAMLANWPFTIFWIMPTNNRLKAIPSEAAGPESRKLLLRWGRLHSVRSVLGAIATLLFVLAAGARLQTT